MINSVIACLFLFAFGAVLFVVNATAPRGERRMQRNANLDHMAKREDSREVAEAE